MRKRCSICGKEISVSPYCKNTKKYCQDCSKRKKKERYKNWYKEKGREYIRQYMKAYFKTIILLLCFFCIGWTEAKQKLGLEEFYGSIGVQSSIVKPPAYQIQLGKVGTQYFSINKFSFFKKPSEDLESTESFSLDEPKERLSWGIEYGATSPNPDISLLDPDSVTGWRLALGNTAEVLYGKTDYGDRTALVSVNTNKYSFMTYKTFGEQMTEEEFFFFDEKKPIPTAKPKDTTKREGGAFAFPFSFRESAGRFEFAVVKRFDNESNSNKKGYAINTDLNAPYFKTALRVLNKGYESDARTIDYSLSGRHKFKDLDDLELRAGYRLLSFTGQPLEHNITAGATKSIFGVALNIESRFNPIKNTVGLTYNASGKVQDWFNISASRSDNITATTTSENNNISISRKEGNISLNYGKSQYRKNFSENIGANLGLNLFGISLSTGLNISESKSPTSYRYTRGSNFSLRYKQTYLSSSFAPNMMRLSLNREINIGEYGKSLTFGLSYYSTKKRDTLSTSINYAW